MARAEAEAPGGRFDELTFYRYMLDHGFDAEAPETWPVEEEPCMTCDDKGILETTTSWNDDADTDVAGEAGTQEDMACYCGASADTEVDHELCECK
ncbi:MAG: hypothetical protein QNJ04_06050 [Desulfobacterales bacterium]|nr:hypothetical protein [Desulfobacterales bacterium]